MKVSFNVGVQSPLLGLPLAYVFQSVLMNTHKDSIRHALRRYLYSIRHENLLQRYFVLWMPAMTITFWMIPDHFRVLFMSSVSFLSLIQVSRASSSSTIVRRSVTTKNKDEHRRQRLERLFLLSTCHEQDSVECALSRQVVIN